MQIALKKHTDYDSFICCILRHGLNSKKESIIWESWSWQWVSKRKTGRVYRCYSIVFMSSDESKLEKTVLSACYLMLWSTSRNEKKLTRLKANKSKDEKWFNVTTASWQWAASCSRKKKILKKKISNKTLAQKLGKTEKTIQWSQGNGMLHW